MSAYIRKLIEQGEGQRLDFKFEIADSKKIARTLSAFSNTDGGKLLLGVKDNGAIAGVRTDEEFYMLEAAAKMYSKPEVSFNMKQWTIEGRTVLEVTVPVGKDKPYYAIDNDGKWLVYIRVKDQNLLANIVLLRVWQRKSLDKGTFIRYSDIEKLLFDYLEENEFITLSKFAKIAGIKFYKAESILVNLICLNIIEIIFTDKQVMYKLKLEPSEASS
jgi:predicted HTH transcriptional regulator